MDGGTWWATVHGVAKRQTRLSDFTFTFHFHALEKEMATHSSVLAWRVPGMGEPDGLPSMGSHRVRHALRKSFIPKSVPLAFPVVTFVLSTPDARHPCQRVRNLLWWATMIVPWRRKWHPTPIFLPGEFYGWKSLAGYSPWSHKELYMTERLSLLFHYPTVHIEYFWTSVTGGIILAIFPGYSSYPLHVHGCNGHLMEAGTLWILTQNLQLKLTRKRTD